MSLPISFRIAARNDLVEAALWHEEQRPGLSKSFGARVDAASSAISERPTSFPILIKNVRRALVPHFHARSTSALKAIVPWCSRSFILRDLRAHGAAAFEKNGPRPYPLPS